MIEEVNNEFYGKEIIITSEVIANDGSTFEDYTLEEHLKYLGLNVER